MLDRMLLEPAVAKLCGGHLYEGDFSSVLNLQTPPPKSSMAQYPGNNGDSGLCWFGFHVHIRKINQKNKLTVPSLFCNSSFWW